MFSRGSRYEAVSERLFRDQSGRETAYKLLRLIPDSPATQQVHAVLQGDRLDLLAHRYYGDPEQFWRICDANRAMLPHELTSEVGRRLLIPLALR